MHCAKHPGVEASLQCTSCSAYWCDECPRKVGLTHHVVCATCGHALGKFSPQRTADDVLARSLRRAVSQEGLITAAAFALFYGLLGSLWVVPIIYLATLVSYYFVTVHHVGAGGAGMPGPAETVDNWTELRMVALGGLVTAGLGFLPVILGVVYAKDPLGGRMLASLVLAGELYMPAIVISVAVTNSPAAALWPPTWIRVVARAPGPYVRFAGLWVVTVIVGLVVWWGTAMSFPDTMFGNVAAAFAWNIFWFFQASIVGEYIRSNAEAFGWD